MKESVKKLCRVIFPILLCLIFVAVLVSKLMLPTSGSERYFAGNAEQYFLGLQEAGFPTDYAVALTELHLLHPNWSFTPLLVTEGNSTYTWSYVIDRETAVGDLNVIYSSASYSAYHHPTNRELYDAGYYQASREAVEYFMDPRNFLNETDIFQFYSLSGGDNGNVENVDAILKGTFMEGKVLENGKTYTQYFLELGRQLDINPVFLATKVRQEQGVSGSSPLISGACGTRLWDFYRNGTQENENGNAVLAPSSGYTEAQLLALDGYYNYFNVNARGNGLFEIYYNAMQYAKTGTSQMASSWGGSGAWNTRWKALYGGASFLRTNYIGRYQPTVYLQKFNVDSRAPSNFSAQYMTSVFGALSEGKTLYQSFAALDMLDAPATFQIPVYAGMPTTPAADPANGSCSVTAQATQKYTFRGELTSPQRISADNQAIYLSAEVYPDATLSLAGVLTHTYAVDGMEYAWDGGEWQTASTGKALKLSLGVHFSEGMLHTLVIRGNTHYSTKNGTVHNQQLFAVIYVNVIPAKSVDVVYRVGNTQTKHTLRAGTLLTLPSSDAPDFAGWCGSDGSFLPAGGEVLLGEENLTYSAVFLDFRQLSGAALTFENKAAPALRFSAVLREDSYQVLAALPDTAISLYATLVQNGVASARPIPLSVSNTVTARGERWVSAELLTPSVTKETVDTLFRAEFYVRLSYTNGETLTLQAVGTPSPRTPRQVATAALSDTSVQYSPTIKAALRVIQEIH